ncbi:MAG: ATP-binding protein [Pirellulales bacterium]|nr:ATP-binding protein [Pirellulales bacterium]
MVNAWIWNWEISIPSRPQAGTDLLEEMIQQLEKRNWLPHDVFGIRLAAEEAIVNAIRHGNQSDADKHVHVSLKMTETRFRLEIRDEGPGFDPTDVPDPTEDDNLEIPSGRGIMLMRNFMSFVEYNETGNCVIMEKERGQGNGDAQDSTQKDTDDEPDPLV